MADYLTFSVGTADAAEQMRQDGSTLASVLGEIGFYGPLGKTVLVEFAEALDEDGRAALAQLMDAVFGHSKLLAAAKEVMATLQEYGPSIVPHLLDTDQNAGQRLRTAIAEAEGR